MVSMWFQWLTGGGIDGVQARIVVAWIDSEIVQDLDHATFGKKGPQHPTMHDDHP
jgi:hypothetical protein